MKGASLLLAMEVKLVFMGSVVMEVWEKHSDVVLLNFGTENVREGILCTSSSSSAFCSRLWI